MTIIMLLGICSIIIAVLRGKHVKYWMQKFIRLDIKYQTILKMLKNNTTIRNRNIIEVVEHLKNNYKSKEFATIITKPEDQLIKIRDGFVDMVLGFCNSSSIDFSANLAYRIRTFNEDGGEWKWIETSYPDNENTADSLAKDKRSTFYHTLSGDWVQFHPCKKQAILDGKYI